MENLMIDMDEVIVKGGLRYLINKFLGTNYAETDFKNYFMQCVIPQSRQKEFYEWIETQNMYEHCTIEPYAPEVMKELLKYYRTYIGTSYLFPEIPRGSGTNLLNKYYFLLDNFPFLTPKNFAFIVDKSVLGCKIRIDDLKSNLAGARRGKRLLYTAYHNEGIGNLNLRIQGIERVNDWIEIGDLLLEKNWKKSLTV